MNKEKQISTLVEFTAKWLNNMKLQYDFELSPEFQKELKEQNLVICYGQSNDCVTFEGAIEQELFLFQGGKIYLNDENEFTKNSIETNINGHICEIEINPRRYSIQASFVDKVRNPTWKFDTKIKHTKFYIWDDTNIFCEGIVFSLEDLE